MNFGKLSHRVSFFRPNSSKDELGGCAENWELAFDTWAMIEPLRGHELEYGMQLVPKANFKVTVRYREGISTKMRITYRDMTLNISGIKDVDEERRYLLLWCDGVFTAS